MPVAEEDPSRSDGNGGVITKSSPWSVADTVVRLEAAIAAKEIKLFAVIDQRREAEAVGLQMPATTLVIFGSPRAGTPVMVAAPLAALDLPLKVLIWDDRGQTKVSYTAPSEIQARYKLDDDLASKLTGINALTDAAVAG